MKRGQPSERLPVLRLRIVALVLTLVVILPFAARVATTGIQVNTDIQSILPDGAAQPGVATAIQQAGEAVAARVAFRVKGDAATARNAVRDLENRLAATGVYQPAADDAAQTLDWLRANRDELSCAPDAAEMGAAWGDRLAERARRLIFSGMIPLSGVNLSDDPFLLDLHHAGCLAPAAQATDDAGAAGRLTASPYRLDVQSAIIGAVDEWRNAWGGDDLQLLKTGAVFFAAAAGEQAKQEIALVGGVSIFLILVLYTLAFRTPVTAGLALLTVAAGALGGAAICYAIFGQVHFSVFVFGSALTGVSADYAVHTLAARRAAITDDAGLRRALTVSMATSAAGFAALLIFDIDLFRQIAVYAIAGLICAWLFALTVIPRLDRSPAAQLGAKPVFLRLSQAISAVTGRRLAIPLALALVFALAALGLPQITYIDDLRRFQAPNADLLAEQNALLDQGEKPASTLFLLSDGATLNDALAAEQTLLAQNGASGVLALSRFDPSSQRRAANRTAHADHLYGPYLATLRAELGLSPPPETTAADLVARPDWLNALWFRQGNRHFTLAPVIDAPPDPATAANPRLIDPVATYGDALTDYRRMALKIISLSALFGAMLLVLIYRSIWAACLMLPPVAGCLLALAIPPLLGAPLTLFSVLALFIVLGAGVDFSVFQWELGRDSSGWTGAAVLIAALSTCAAMGMLGFSATLPVQSFGVTIAIGVLTSMAISFLAPVAGRGIGAKLGNTD